MNPPQHKPPYWTRAHKDWRLWVGVLLMLIAMVVYVMSEDLSLVPATDAPPAAAVTGE